MKVRQKDSAIHINVRSAKDSFSKLLELASQGEDVIITSDGKPKARLTLVKESQRQFRVNWDLLQAASIRKKGKLSEEIIREARDSRY